MADPYRIGVSIVLANGVSPVLAIIARDMLGLRAPIGAIERSFGRWTTAIGATAAILGGSAIIGGLAAIAKHGGAVNHQLELMKIAGMDNAEIQDSIAQAMKTTGSVMTTTLSENLAHIRELRYAFGETSTAMQHLDEISKANAILNSIKGGGKDQVWELVKSLEQKGLTYKPEEFSSYVDTMTKVIEATGGKVTPEMFMSTFKYGRTAMLGWDEAFVGGALPRLMQSMATGGGAGGSGSGGPGNALMSAFAKVVQGQMPKKAAQNWEEMGLTPGGVQHIEGSSQSLVPKISGADLFMANPYEWVQQVLMPALAAKGITSQNEIIARIAGMFPVRTAGQVITEMALQGRFHEGMGSPFEKDIALQKGAMGQAGFDELMKNDYPMILKSFNQQWKNLLETLGSPMMQPGGPVLSAMAGLTATMGALAAFAGKNNEMIKTIVEIFGQIGAIIVKIDTAGLHVIGAMTGISTMFGALAQLPWGAISSGLAAVNAGLSGLAGALDKLKGFFGIGGANAKPAEPSFQDRWGGLKQHSMFNPGTTELKAAPISLSLNIDGRVLAQNVSEQLDYLYEHATGSPNYNAQSHFSRADGGMAST